MIRKLLILIAVSVLVLAVLGGCGGRNDEPAEVVAPAEAPAEEVVVEEEAPAEEAEIVVEEGAEEAAEAPAEEEAVAEEEAPAEEAVAEEEPVAEEEVPAEEAVEEPVAEEEGAADEAAADEAGAEEAAAEEAAAEEAEDMEVVVGEGEEEAVEGAADEAEVVEEAEAEEVAEAEGDATAEEAAEETEEGDAEAEMAESTGVVTVESARAIRDIVNERQPAFTAVSPDGSMLVYAITQGRFWNNTNSICFFTFANANRSCYEIDSNEYLGYMPSFVWSPDSSVVAFTENPIQLGFESDIWVMDAADGSMVNLTDDGVIGSWTVAERGTYALDYEPMWDEETGDLYFWRSEPTGNLAITFQLMRFPAGSEEAELVHDVSAELEGLVMTWDIEDYYLDGPSALSPDGSKVAMAIQSLDSLSEDERVGVWMLDVASGELTQMATAEDYRLAIPDWHEARARGVANQWTADSSGFVTLISSPTSRLPLIVFNYTDAETGEITPVVDFSNVESQEALMTAPEDGIPPRFYSPWTATVSPAGDKLFMLSNLAGVAGLITAPLPPVVGAEPEVAGAAESFTTMGGTRSSTSETGKVVIFGFLLTTVEE